MFGGLGGLETLKSATKALKESVRTTKLGAAVGFFPIFLYPIFLIQTYTPFIIFLNFLMLLYPIYTHIQTHTIIFLVRLYILLMNDINHLLFMTLN